MSNATQSTVSQPNPGSALLGRLLSPGPHVTYIIFIIIIGFFVIFAPNFATWGTAGAVGRITAVVTIMAVGMTFVIVCGEIDLSVGSHVSFAAMVVAMLLYNDVPGWIASPLVLLLGAGVGAINCIIVTKLRIPSFLVTLGMLSVLRGLALSFTGSMPVPIVDREYVEVLAGGTMLGIPAPIWWTLVTVVAGFYLLHMTVFGKRALATGGNTIAPRFSGINTDLIRIIAFALCGVTASMAGLVLSARSAAGNPIPRPGPRTRCHRRGHHRRNQPVRWTRLHSRFRRRRHLHRYSRLRPHRHGPVDEYPGSGQGADHHRGGFGQQEIGAKGSPARRPPANPDERVKA